MLTGIDTGTSQRALNFEQARAQGVSVCYVKLGGDNSGRYVAPYYAAQVDQSRAHGLRTGHYWVPGGDAASAAAFFCANLRNPSAGDFYVLDNEKLDSGRLYGDAEAALWLRTVAGKLKVPFSQLFMYVGAADLRARSWPECEALGVKLIVASYGANSGNRDHEPNLGGRFKGKWAGHQYTSQARIGGITIDMNVFQDWAFDYAGTAGLDTELIENKTEDEMELIKIICNEKGANYGSTAVSGSAVPDGWLQTSVGLGPRGELDAWTAIANAVGAVVREVSVDNNGFELSRRFAAPAPGVTAAPIINTDAITSSVVSALTAAGVGAAGIAAAVDKVLADNFAAIPDAVVDEQADRLNG